MWGYGDWPGWDCGWCRLDGSNGRLLHCGDSMIYKLQETATVTVIVNFFLKLFKMDLKK